MYEEILEKIGLTKTEARIYETLLRAGQSTTTVIVRESGIHASKVYEFLDKLIDKGLVSYIIRRNKKYFMASTPKNLRNIIGDKQHQLQQQQIELDSIIPKLEAITSSRKEAFAAEIYEGMQGIKAVYERILHELSRGETQYIIGAPRIGNERLEGFLLEWHKRRIKKGIRCRYIYDSDARAYGWLREKMPLTQVRYLTKNTVSPVWIEIFGACVFIGHIMRHNAVVFLLKDADTAGTYLDYFSIIWKSVGRNKG